MGVLGTCTVRTLKKNPVRTAVTVVGIALATALILAVITSALSLYSYLVNVEMARSGSYNGTVDGITASELRDVEKEPGITGAAAVQLEGYAVVNEANALTPYVVVEGLVPGATADFGKLVALNLVDGRLPENADEVLLPITLVRSGILDVGIGDTVTFDVGARVGSDGHALLPSAETQRTENWELTERLVDMAPRSFTVCGLYGDSNPLFWLSDFGGNAAALPVLTVAPVPEEAPSDALYQVWVTVDNPLDTSAVMREALGSRAQAVSIRTNSYINHLTSFSLGMGGYQTLFGFTALVLGAVVVSSLLLVRTSFSISVSERTRQFGLLSSVGATRRQLRGMVMREALGLSIIAIPLGLLIGYVGTAAVLFACRELVANWATTLMGIDAAPVALSVVVSPAVLVGTVLLALGTTLVSAWGPARRAGHMSAIDALRSAADVRIPSGVRRSGFVAGKLFGVEGSIAAKSFKRARKPRRATIIALVTGTVLVATASLLGVYVNEVLTTAKPESQRSHDLQYWFSESNISAVNGQGATPEEAVERLVASDGITKAATGIQLIALTTDEGALTKNIYSSAFTNYFPGYFNTAVIFADDDSFREWLENAGVDSEPYFDPSHPQAVAVNVMGGTEEGRYVRFEPFTGTPFKFEGTTEVSVESGYSTGPASFMAGDDRQGFSEGWRTISFDVSTFVDQAPWWIDTPSQPIFMLPLSMAGSVDETLVSDVDRGYLNRFWEVWVRSDDPAATELAMTAQLQSLGLSPTRLYNRTEQTAGLVSLFATAQVFIWAFAVIVTLIAITSAFNTMVTSVGLRRREFAVLRSVGLTKKGLYKMLACECCMYSVRVLLWSIPVSCLMSLGLWAFSSATVASGAYHLPWAVVPAALGAYVVVCAATAHAVRSADAASPIEALRSENI